MTGDTPLYIFNNMKNLFHIVLVLFLSKSAAYCQKENYIWVNGHDSFSSNPIFGGINIDFNGDTVQAIKIDRFIDFGKGNDASICDSSGQLLFYSNGCFIANKENQLMENGDSLNSGEVYNSYCGDESLGYTSGFQSSIILPLPASDSLYYLFHKRIFLFFNPFDVKTLNLLYSLVDISRNNGLGKVIEKNKIALQDTLSFGEMTAVRHANGVDWWLVSPGDRNNKYFIFSFTQNGLALAHTQILGDTTPPAGEGGGYAIFNPDGSKYIRFNPHNKVRMFDFDRNTGLLSNYQHIDVDFGDSEPFDGGCLISPSGQFLYISVKRYLYQMDLWSDNIEASQVLVGTYDGYADPLVANFGRGLLGPDCKLYVFPGNDTRVIHVIHNPNEPGLACNFEQHALHTPTYHGATFPNFPDFRLKALGEPVSPCEGYTVGIRDVALHALPVVSVYPNPADTYLHIAVREPLSAPAHWVLYDLYGRAVRSMLLVAGSERWQSDVAGLPAGVYAWQLSGSGIGSVGGKIVRSR